jgi:hypothetical protein
MLSVGQFKKTVRRTTEKSFEDLVAAAWLERGVWSRHMSDKFSGVPDRYIRGGRWAELKSLEYKRGQVPYGAGMSVEQRRVCQELVDNGEEVWYMALIHTDKGQYVIWQPMNITLGEPGNVTDVYDYREACHPWHYPYDGKKSVIANMPRDWK